MTEPLTRPELDARLKAIEARMDGRIARIEDAVQRIAVLASEMKTDNREIRQSVSKLKIVVITSAIGGATAIVFGVATFNASLT